MFSFLKKIRKKLLSSGSLGKYTVYASGEIILVVIGILIALQINNQNEFRKDRKQEIKILKGLKDDLSKNVENLTTTIKRQNKTQDRRWKLIYIFEEYEASEIKEDIVDKYQDSIGRLFMLGGYSYFREEMVSGTYDAMVGSGNAGIIQNEDLIKLLAEYYAEINAGFEDHETQMAFLSTLVEKTSPHLQAFWPWFNEEYSDFYYQDDNIKKKAIHSFLSDSSIEGILLPMSFGELNRRKRQSMLLDMTENLIKIIEKGLNKD